MYNNSSINISYYNGDIEVQFTNQKGINIGKIGPYCDGYITSDNNKQKNFQFNEKKKEIVWTGPGSEDKWIGGYFC